MMAFTINGRSFSPDRVDTVVKIGAVEEWTFANPTLMDHPIHLHTNPFQVLAADGQPRREWKDTINVKRGTETRFLVRFADYTGKSMYHCHILNHEDLGMMAVVQVE